jgi:F-type H+-transporting ATPase subunit gamma
MPNLIDIRRRIRSVKNTQQITKAMKMVAAARLRRSQERVIATRPYSLRLRTIIANLAAKGASSHPLLEQRPDVRRTLLVVVSGDKGLCGSFNTNVLRRATRRLKELPNADVMTLGKKASDYFRRRWPRIRAAHSTLFTRLERSDAEAIAHDITAAFIGGEYDAVHVIYNEFKSMISQELRDERLLPLEPPTANPSDAGEDVLYEPNAEAILSELLPRFVTYQVYRMLLESQAAEHAARMTAMESATKNAKQMIERLTLSYNRARQAAITKELIEIVSGANALEA